MFMKTLLGILFIISTLSMSPLFAQEQPGPDSTAAPPAIKQPGWLGVWVQPLPPELSAQLAHLIPSGQGLMVAQVENNSPAQQAGIQPFDVLVSFAGQKLYSPEQLSSLVSNFNADNKVELEIIHQGQLQTLNATLAANQKRTLARTHRHRPPYPVMPRHRPYPPPLKTLPDDSSAWDKFESVEVKTLADGRYRAVVSFKDQTSETRTFTFEGKKYEIIQQIKELKELPEDKKRALLRALNLQPGRFPDYNQFDFTRDFFNAPLFNQRWFSQNLFNQYPFDQPFLRDPYYRDNYYSEPWGGRGYPPPWQLHIYPDRPGWNNQR